MEIQTSQFTEEIQAWLVSYLAELLEIEPDEVDVTIPFDRYGLDSAAAMSITADLEEWSGHELEPTIMYDHDTIEALARHLSEVNGELTKIDRTQRVEQENNEQTLSTDVKESDWIEVEL